MKTNKIDKNIQKKFVNRTLKPSNSAWERLSAQLDEQPKQKKNGWFFFIGAAASILLLVSIGIQLFSDDQKDFLPKNEVVIEEIDKDLIDEKLEKFINEIPLEEVIVKKEKVDKEVNFKTNFNGEKSKKIILKNQEFQKLKVVLKKEKIVIAKIEEIQNVVPTKEEPEVKEPFKQKLKSSIKINSDDLLYAVTHTSKEVKEYYAKYNVNRDDVLRTIRNQLKESNLKVNPNTILAEVERTIEDDVFQNNFLKSLTKRVTDIASAIVRRND
ncbi:MAG: hypothetical protein ACJAYY_001054 [Paraglaciecola sp.]|jgi:hypothetical protein